MKLESDQFVLWGLGLDLLLVIMVLIIINNYYLDRISAFTKFVRGFDAATAVSIVFPCSSSPSSVTNKIDPIAV